MSSAPDRPVRQHEYKIVVNTREKAVDHDELAFDEVIRLAFDPVPTGPNVEWSITFRHAAQHPSDGTMAVGGTVTIKNGTAFNVTPTDKS